MSTKRQIAIMIDLDWAYRHHLDVFSGTQQYAEQHGQWEVRIDPHADDTLPARGKASPYDGIIGRATRKLATRAKRLGVPVVNVWFNSPAQGVPSVLPDLYAGLCVSFFPFHFLFLLFDMAGFHCLKVCRNFNTVCREY